jgi:hypothetical protein
MAWKGVGNDSNMYVAALTGNTWSSPVKIPNAGTSTTPSLASGTVGSTSYLVLAWKGLGTDTRVFYAYTTNGTTWKVIGQVPGPATNFAPSIGIAGTHIYLGWTALGHITMDQIHATLGTFSWSAPAQLSGTGGTSAGPVLGTAPTFVRAAWAAQPGDPRIFTKTFAVGTAGPAQQVVPLLTTSGAPGLSSSPANFPYNNVLAWTDEHVSQVWVGPVSKLVTN